MGIQEKHNGFEFRLAESEEDFIKIHKLNYETFVKEIPQHTSNEEGILVDAFHEKNLYFMCLDYNNLVGMVAVNGNPPFSLEKKLDDLSKYLPTIDRICEIRLLSISKKYRKGMVIRGLLTVLGQYCLKKNYKIAIISGNVKQQRMYNKLGFVNFGQIVGTEEAKYQPMYLNLEDLANRFDGLVSLGSNE